MRKALGVVAAAALAMAGCASVGEELGLAKAAAAHRGEGLATAKCAGCHTIAGGAASPVSRATPFPEIAKRYTRNGLTWELEAINDVGHYQMPTTALSRDQMSALVAYIHPQQGPS
ncbi:cytochrome c [Phenylobacterium sp.]|uniref:c-type cytochrome n=1 Tax=Phenylobacterium sp. TaxID=1871053 RepID=UPI0025D7D679|nr:cytochrome c [Phenylobacterium sp.]